MDLGGPELMAITVCEFVDHELVKGVLEILEVGHVAGRADDGGRADGVQALNVLEAGERAVGRCGWVRRITQSCSER